MPSERACGAARTIAPGNVAVCERLPSRHAGLDHRDFRHAVSWPVCESYCPASARPGDPPERHVCGRYRGRHDREVRRCLTPQETSRGAARDQPIA